jgi:nitroimidazol reductase NimA-like FMN-containing flavoprotein (pyridoxamine 5'-phosphate oxidase superfamily)
MDVASAKRLTKARAPVASRPKMPDYGLLEAREGRGLLPWSWAERHLSDAHNYWIATTRADGRPHCVAVWGVWHDGAFWFCSGPNSLKVRNLRRNPDCVVCPEPASEAVVLEGRAEEVTAAPALKRFAAVYKKKYDSDYTPKLGPAFAVRPRVATGLIEFEMQSTATRWEFGGGRKRLGKKSAARLRKTTRRGRPR